MISLHIDKTNLTSNSVCPGKNLALLSYTLFASHVLYYLDIGPKEGAELTKPYDRLSTPNVSQLYTAWRPIFKNTHQKKGMDVSKFYIETRLGRKDELEREVEAAREFLRNHQ